MTLMPRVPVNSGSLSFSRLIYGCWRMADAGQDTRTQVVARRIESCLERGITTFDHADIYGNYRVEQVFGEALKAAPALKNRIEIITKCGIKLVSSARPEHALKTYDTRAEHILHSTENSLRQLGVEAIDLLLVHRPSPLMDPHEVALAFSKLHKEGKVKAFGVSNFLPHQVEMLRSFSAVPLVANQVEFHCLRTEPLYDGTLDQCLRLKMLPMAWSPLAGGQLAAAPANDDASTSTSGASATRGARIRLVQQTLAAVGKRHDAGIEQTALAWLLAHPAGVMPVVGTQRTERLTLLADATRIALTQDEWFDILRSVEGREVP